MADDMIGMITARARELAQKKREFLLAHGIDPEDAREYEQVTKYPPHTMKGFADRILGGNGDGSALERHQRMLEQ